LKRFYKDFEIFPDIVNLIQTKNIFDIIADSLLKEKIHSVYHTPTKGLGNITSTNNLFHPSDNKLPNINFGLFLESLALASFHSFVNVEKGALEKIIYLIEKISNSSGIKKSQLISGETL